MVRSGPDQLELQNGRFGTRTQLQFNEIWAWPARASKWSDLGLASWSPEMVRSGSDKLKLWSCRFEIRTQLKINDIWAWPAGAPKWSIEAQPSRA